MSLSSFNNLPPSLSITARFSRRYCCQRGKTTITKEMKYVKYLKISMGLGSRENQKLPQGLVKTYILINACPNHV
jgi:hypothetical protein